MNYRVFISYSAKDEELAKDLERRLRDAGVEVFLSDSKISAGEGWRRKIFKTLSQANEVVMLLTDNSANSPWIRYEMGVADSLEKRLTPVVVNEGVEQLVPMLGKQFIRYADLPKYISSLKRRAEAA